MNKFAIQYTELESKVLDALVEKVNKSKKESSFISKKAIRVYYNDYVELSILNDNLILLDVNGNHYSLLSVCDLPTAISFLDLK